MTLNQSPFLRLYVFFGSGLFILGASLVILCCIDPVCLQIVLSSLVVCSLGISQGLKSWKKLDLQDGVAI